MVACKHVFLLPLYDDHSMFEIDTQCLNLGHMYHWWAFPVCVLPIATCFSLQRVYIYIWGQPTHPPTCDADCTVQHQHFCQLHHHLLFRQHVGNCAGKSYYILIYNLCLRVHVYTPAMYMSCITYILGKFHMQPR